MKIALSIEQMQHLESLGLDTSDASMLWLDNGREPTLEFNVEAYHEHPYNIFVGSYAYTLQDITQKITSWSNHLVISFVYFDEGVSCILSTENDNVLHDCSASVYKKETDIDASYKMLLWCIENGYIKTNKV